MSEHMSRQEAEAWQEAVMAGGEDFAPEDMTAYIANLAADTLEYGVARPDDEGWGVWWDDQLMQDWGTLDEARGNLARVKRHCPDARLVCRRVSAPWEVTDE